MSSWTPTLDSRQTHSVYSGVDTLLKLEAKDDNEKPDLKSPGTLVQGINQGEDQGRTQSPLTRPQLVTQGQPHMWTSSQQVERKSFPGPSTMLRGSESVGDMLRGAEVALSDSGGLSSRRETAVWGQTP